MLRNAAEGDFDGVWVRHEDEASGSSEGEGDLDEEGEEPVRLWTGTYSLDCEDSERAIVIGLDIAKMIKYQVPEMVCGVGLGRRT